MLVVEPPAGEHLSDQERLIPRVRSCPGWSGPRGADGMARDRDRAIEEGIPATTLASALYSRFDPRGA